MPGPKLLLLAAAPHNACGRVKIFMILCITGSGFALLARSVLCSHSWVSHYRMVQEPAISMARKSVLPAMIRHNMKPTLAWLTKRRLSPTQIGNMGKVLVPEAHGPDEIESDFGFWKGGPANFHDDQARMAQHLLEVDPWLFDTDVDKKLEALGAQRDDDERQWQIPDKFGGENNNALYKKIHEIQQNQRMRSIMELLYLKVCSKFKQLQVPLIPSLKAGGRAESGGTQNMMDTGDDDQTRLTHLVYTGDDLELVVKNLVRALHRKLPSTHGSDVRMFSMYEVAELYAQASMFGYSLRNANRRFRLEKAADSISSTRLLEDYIVSLSSQLLTM